MKKNIVPIVVVVVLFACVAVVSFASKDSAPKTTSNGAQDATVKICPHSGLPCEGDGDCGECEE